jgi:adenylate cyclase
MARRARSGVSWTAAVAPASVLILLLVVRALHPPAVQDAQLRTFDAFQRLAPRAYRPAPVRIVDIDDDSLAKRGQWPWPRTLVAELVDKLAALGAGPIAFDIVFAEPDRTSPASVLPLWPETPATEALRADLAQVPDHDAVLAEAIGRASVVTGFALTAEPSQGTRLPALKAGFAFSGEDPLEHLAPFPGTVVNLPALEAAAAGNGHFVPSAEGDGVIRRVPVILRFGQQLYPSLVAESLRLAQGASTYVVKTSKGSGEGAHGIPGGIVSVKVGKVLIPTDAQGRVWVYYTKEVPERTISAWKVLDGAVEPQALAGCLVFLGTSATGLKDIRITPLNPVAPGVEVHAQLAEQALAGEFLRRPDWADGAELVYLLALGLVLILLLPRAGAAACAALGAGAVAAACGLSWYAFVRFRWLLDPVVPSAAALAIYLVGSLTNFLRTEAERRQVRQAFSRYLSPAMVDRLVAHPEQLRLGGERRTMTILFSDIRGFTTIAEQYDAEGLARFMNRFLTPMTRVILEQEGTIDKYVGDCIMAFWNAPLDDPQHPRHACQAALGMRRHLVTLNQELRAEREREGKPFLPVHIGIGLNTGECSVGNFGSDQRFDYSVLGDTVNLASRLEGQSKMYGTDIVAGAETTAGVPDYAALELDLIIVMGKTKPATIFAVLGDPAMAAEAGFQQLRQRHGRLLEAYRGRRWAEAREHLEACLALDTPRTRLRVLYGLYRLRIDAYEADPPAEDWNGVFVAQTK